MSRRYENSVVKGGMVLQAPGEKRRRLVFYAFTDQRGRDYFIMTSGIGPEAFVYSQGPDDLIIWTEAQIRAKIDLESGGWKVVRDGEYEWRKYGKTIASKSKG